MADTSDFKNGLVLKIDGQLQQIIEFQHVKPGKGPAFVRTKLKNVLSGKVVDKTFNAGVKVETATVDRRDMTYLYHDGSDYVFMDGDTYDQISISEPTIGEGARFLLENMAVQVATHEGDAALRRASGHGRARGQAHRPGPAGRPLHRRHQAGDAGDRRRDQGAAVHQHRRQAEGRLPRRQLPRRRREWLTSDRPEAHKKLGARHKARKRAVDLLFEAEARDIDPAELARSGSISPRRRRVARVNPYTVTILEGVADNLDRIDGTIESLPAGLDARTAARRGPGDPADRGVGVVPRDGRAAGGRGRRGGRVGEATVHRRLAVVRQRRARPGRAGRAAGARGCGGDVAVCGGRRRRVSRWILSGVRRSGHSAAEPLIARATAAMSVGETRQHPPTMSASQVAARSAVNRFEPNQRLLVASHRSPLFG